MKETDLVKSIERQLQYHANDVMAWRQNTGGAKFKKKGGGEYFVRFGFQGISDIIGLIAPHGRFVGIECKVGKNKMTEQQLLFGYGILKRGGIFIEARQPEDWKEIFNFDSDKWFKIVTEQMQKQGIVI